MRFSFLHPCNYPLCFSVLFLFSIWEYVSMFLFCSPLSEFCHMTIKILYPSNCQRINYILYKKNHYKNNILRSFISVCFQLHFWLTIFRSKSFHRTFWISFLQIIYYHLLRSKHVTQISCMLICGNKSY